jgi:2-polyprenyl-3-methyl-5-hydroxy-6-metoxy-1,4-benzoquinol methylase
MASFRIKKMCLLKNRALGVKIALFSVLPNLKQSFVSTKALVISLQLNMKLFKSRMKALDVRLWELGIRSVPKAIIPFISQGKTKKGSDFQVRLVGSSGFAALGEPVRIFNYLFSSDKYLEKKFLSRQTMVLDHGCGIGRFSVVLRAYGKDPANIRGVDVLDECIKNFVEIVEAGAESVLNQEINEYVGNNFFDSTISYSVFTHLPFEKASKTLTDLFLSTKKGGIVCLTIWNERLIKYLNSDAYSSYNGYWWDNLRQTIGKFSDADLARLGVIFAPNSGGDGLPSDVYGDTVYSANHFVNMAESVGWNTRKIINEESLTLQTIIILEKL